jgi:nucleotide-binding universal stress UspA family protein
MNLAPSEPSVAASRWQACSLLLHLQEVSVAVRYQPSWSKPSTILFAAEIPANETAFAFALAQAAEYDAKLILFHAYEMRVAWAPKRARVVTYDGAAAARAVTEHLGPLAERARQAGVECETVVRPGLATDQLLAFLYEREIDRVVIGAHSPGSIGKLLVGSVAEAVLRAAREPVYVVGPEVQEIGYTNFAIRSILCGISLHESSTAVAGFAAELAVEHNARLLLQHVIRPQEQAEVLASQSIEEMEDELVSLIPPELQDRIAVQAIVTQGDPTEELLSQGRAQQADLMVLGAQGASAFAAVARHGVVYKMLAHAHCPVMTLSPVVLASCGVRAEKVSPAEVFLAGVF